MLGEVLTAKPIFAGEDEFDQLSSIMEASKIYRSELKLPRVSRRLDKIIVLTYS